MKQTNRDFVLAVEARQLVIQVRLNDVLLVSGQGGPVDRSELVNPWLLTGRNTVKITVETPGVKPFPFLPRISVIFRPNVPGTPDLFVYRWPNDKQKVNTLPAENPANTSTFTLDDRGFGPFIWTSGPAEPPNQDLEDELALAFDEIYRAFQARDVEALMKFSEQRTTEMAQAWGVDREALANIIRSDWARTFDDGDTQFVRRDAKNRRMFKYLPGWNNHVFQILPLDGSQAIQTLPRKRDGLVTGYDVYLAKINKAWKWVR